MVLTTRSGHPTTAARLPDGIARDLVVTTSALESSDPQRGAKLARRANEDGLTGLANRRAFDRAFADTFSAARDSAKICTLVFADIDHFKRVNDRYSHLVGDEVLRQIGQLLEANCRPDDLVARYGGEEFVLLLPRCTGHEAHRLCERLRTASADHDWEAIAPGLQITLSIGFATSATATTPEHLLAEADAQLYQAKHSGRNRVCPPR